jgi:hypothetical protein
MHRPLLHDHLLHSRGPELPALYATSAAILLISEVLIVYTLPSLGWSFSLVPQARTLVTSGPYAIVRHPLYLVEETAIAGILLQYVRLVRGAAVPGAARECADPANATRGRDPSEDLSGICRLRAAHAAPSSWRVVIRRPRIRATSSCSGKYTVSEEEGDVWDSSFRFQGPVGQNYFTRNILRVKPGHDSGAEAQMPDEERRLRVA